MACYFGVQLKVKLGYDDALDAFGVHGIGGIVGGILVCVSLCVCVYVRPRDDDYPRVV